MGVILSWFNELTVSVAGEGGGGVVLMLGIQLCPTDQGRFFTFKNPTGPEFFDIFFFRTGPVF